MDRLEFSDKDFQRVLHWMRLEHPRNLLRPMGANSKRFAIRLYCGDRIGRKTLTRLMESL